MKSGEDFSSNIIANSAHMPSTMVDHHKCSVAATTTPQLKTEVPFRTHVA